MTDIRELYQEVILDHYRKPRNFAVLDDATGIAEGHNPLCGDRMKVTLVVRDDRVEQIAFQGAGCAISTAAASLMTEAVRGKGVNEARTLFQRFHQMLTHADAPVPGELGKLEVFTGVRDYPVRIKCATLPWHTLQAALDGDEQTVSTEASTSSPD